MIHLTDNDIIGFALDLDNNKVYAYKNGNPQDDPTPDPDDNDGRAIVSAYNNYWTPWMSKDDTNHNATVEGLILAIHLLQYQVVTQMQMDMVTLNTQYPSGLFSFMH